MKLVVDLKENSYPIYIEEGILYHIQDYIDLNRKVLIVTDQNIPLEYATCIKDQAKEGYIYQVTPGEEAKSFACFQDLCRFLLDHHFTRKDVVVAVGGGVVGDLSGYVAASYMRGIDFIQIPTTTLSQIDSSIGGKVAINLDGVKNIIGAFYQPKAVFIDFHTLKTLPTRHFYNGLVEALKAGMIYDEELFKLFEQEDIKQALPTIIYRALCVKKDVVEKDEKEQNLRKILNFGHTIGHAIESYYQLSQYYHGECVALGMLYFTTPELRKRLEVIYDKMHLKKHVSFDVEEVFAYLRNDKKTHGDVIDVVYVEQLGHAQIRPMKFDEIKDLLRG